MARKGYESLGEALAGEKPTKERGQYMNRSVLMSENVVFAAVGPSAVIGFQGFSGICALPLVTDVLPENSRAVFSSLRLRRSRLGLLAAVENMARNRLVCWERGR